MKNREKHIKYMEDSLKKKSNMYNWRTKKAGRKRIERDE